MSKYHKEAIEILKNESLDFKNLCLTIAKNNPYAFCQAFYTKKSHMLENQLILDVKNILKSDQSGFINAIKYVRSVNKMCIKDARKVVEKIRGY